MNRFTKEWSGWRLELRVVPRAAWVVATFLYVALACVFQLVIHFGNDPGMTRMPLAGQLALTLCAPLMIVVLVALIGYVNGDAKRRGMRYVMWTLLATFVPDCIGIILYFIVRDPLPNRCRSCGQNVLAKFVFCPHCGAATQPTCPQCGHAVNYMWANCAYCGVKLPRQSIAAA
jgi:hypothetical protein